jgi:hypothetical protein
MSLVEFSKGKLYYRRLPLATFGSLSVDDIESVYSDGRAASALIEREIVNQFTNLAKIYGDKSSDIEDTITNGKYELRGMSKKADKIDLPPSNQRGAGRVFNEAKHQEKTERD